MRIFWITITVASLGVSGWLFWSHQQTSNAMTMTLREVAPLVEYRDLYHSGREREANDILLKTIASLIEAENQGVDLNELLRRAERINNTPVNYSDLLTKSLLRNIKIARELDLDSPANLQRMKLGRSPVVGSGPYKGETAEVDHIVPRSLAPDLDNLLINLELMPRTLNRRKGNKVTDRVQQMAKTFFEAGVMQAQSFETIQETWRSAK